MLGSSGKTPSSSPGEQRDPDRGDRGDQERAADHMKRLGGNHRRSLGTESSVSCGVTGPARLLTPFVVATSSETNKLRSWSSEPRGNVLKLTVRETD